MKTLLFMDKAINIKLPNFINISVNETNIYAKVDITGVDSTTTAETGSVLKVPSSLRKVS